MRSGMPLIQSSEDDDGGRKAEVGIRKAEGGRGKQMIADCGLFDHGTQVIAPSVKKVGKQWKKQKTE
jgi:hypothetical protein